jgi:hypothetical protein
MSADVAEEARVSQFSGRIVSSPLMTIFGFVAEKRERLAAKKVNYTYRIERQSLL